MSLPLPLPAAPETVFFSITEECPQRCKVCSMWEARDPPDSLTPASRMQVVTQLPGFETPVADLFED